MAITYTSGEQVEVYRFSIPATILIPLTAVFLQAFLPQKFHIFDIPLLVTIGFATARRSQLARFPRWPILCQDLESSPLFWEW